jgi:hypothetical protein
MGVRSSIVIPAKAGIYFAREDAKIAKASSMSLSFFASFASLRENEKIEIPAFAGMTGGVL